MTAEAVRYRPTPGDAGPSVRAVQAAAERIHRYRRVRDVFAQLDGDLALADARDADQRLAGGVPQPLAGVWLVMDDPAPDGTAAGPPDEDPVKPVTEIAGRLRDAGAALMGVTHPPARPGAAGGGATAVGAGLIPVALVDPATGWPRCAAGVEPVMLRPAAWPSEALRPPGHGRGPALMTATAMHARRAWQAVLGGPATSLPADRRGRLAVSLRAPGLRRRADARMVDAVEDVAAVLSAQGFEVVHHDLEFAWGMPSPAVCPPDVDALLTPWRPAPDPAVRLSWGRFGQLQWLPERPPMPTVDWQAAGCSSVLQTVDWADGGAPLAVCLVARAGAEGTLLDLADLIEARLPVG